MTDHPDDSQAAIRARLLEQMVPTAGFDGWSDLAFRRAANAAGIDERLARNACPEGALDLAVDFVRDLDARMLAAMAERRVEFAVLPLRERIHEAIVLRLSLAEPDREAVRRAVVLFALPGHMAQGARLVAGTVDAIWRAVGDTSTDASFYTKRLILGAIYTATLTVWLADEEDGFSATRAFLARRLEATRILGSIGRAGGHLDAGAEALARLLGRLRYPGTGGRA